VTFTVTATSAGPLNYQWQRKGFDIPGANGQTYSIAAAATGDAGTYAVRVSNSMGSVMSSGASLTVKKAPSITRNPKKQTVQSGSMLVLSVESDGSGPLSYNWLKDGQYIPGATSSVYEVTEVQETDAGAYMVEVANDVGNVLSEVAVVTVTPIPETTLVAAISATAPDAMVLTVSGAPGTYEIQKSVDLNGSWTSILSTNITGATAISVPVETGKFEFFRTIRVQN
jgi:hypothetical protein